MSRRKAAASRRERSTCPAANKPNRSTSGQMETRHTADSSAQMESGVEEALLTQALPQPCSHAGGSATRRWALIEPADLTFVRLTLRGASTVEGIGREETGGGCHSSEETHICEKCCAEFFSWTQLSEHQKVCTEDPLVLIVKDNNGRPVPEESPMGPSPVPSMASTDSSAAESTGAGFELGETLGNDKDSLDNLELSMECDEAMELEHRPQDKYTTTSSPQPPDSTESTSPEKSATGSYGMPSTNVTLEILHSTRVAVAQFSQGINSGTGGKAASAAIPVILEHLLALQQQQVHQLQLIEQICSQVAIMNRQPTQAALNPVSRSLSLAPNPFPSQGIITPPILPLSGTIPSTINGQAAVSLSSVLDKSQSLSSPTAYGQSTFRDITCTSASSENSTPSLSSCSSSISTLLPPYTGSLTSSISCVQTLSSSSPLPLGQSSLLSSSSSLSFLPQSPPSSVIFPNPLASIAATANALDPLAALMKHRKGKLPNMPLFETNIGGSNDPVSVTPSAKSPFLPAPGECVSLSPNHRGGEAHFAPVSESPQSNRETEAANVLETEGVPLPQNCSQRLRGNPVVETTSTTTPPPVTSASPVSSSPPLSFNSEETKFPTGGFLDSMQTSETSKLQQLHIRMHMVGQIQDSTLVDGLQEMDSNISFNDRNLDSLSSNDNDLIDDISMEDDNVEEEDEVENIEEVVNPSKPLISDYSPPKSSTIVSSIAALENQMRMIDSTLSLNHSFGITSLTNGFNDSSQLNVKCSLSGKRQENCSLNSPSVSESSCSPSVSVSPIQSNLEGMTIKSPAVKNNRPESQEPLAASVKREQSESPTSALAATVAHELRGIQASKLCVKEETPYSMSFHLSRERAAGQSIPSLDTNTLSGLIKTEVHMGTHMWNNAPARRGRRLSVDNPMALLSGEAAKFGEMFQKDLAARAMNVDPGFWNRYATAIANSLATKNNEISVIQNRGISQLHPLTAGIDRVSSAGSPITSLTKTGMDLRNNRHFSMLIDDSKEIGIN
ncbi:hypothetical protein FQN60_007779 [Etheostoma spectabile]|uniref:C2H2-type domain-containing protein n=1 Tax=Etheostoma spectabile TaxID=54343 RepID=A0A5J5D013_9PERO|nr:hypothetical protein FQN60_007779 [Etheostoma spectabile]